MATEKAVIGQAQRILVDATNNIWHKISTWTHASDVEMPSGEPLNEYLTDLNDSVNERFDAKYNSYNLTTTSIGSLDAIPEIGYSRIQTIQNITAGEYTIPINHTCYCYSGQDPASIEKMAVMIDTTDLTSIVMYIAHYSREARWTLTKIATQKQIDNLQMQIDELNSAFNQLNLFVQQSVGDLNARYQIIQDQMDWLEAELAELQEQLNDLLNELRDFKAAANAKFAEIDKIFQSLYGYVGSIFITTAVSIKGKYFGDVLSELFGGTWKMVQNAYLYAGATAAARSIDDAPWTPTTENTRKYTRSELGNNYDAGVTTGADWNFSPIYSGRDSFVLDKSNLPEHRHRANEVQHDNGAIVSYELKYGRSNTPANAFADVFLPDSVGEYASDYFTVAAHKSYMSNVGRPGYGFIEPVTGPNAFPDEPLSQPVELNPTRFKVYVWCRIE